jgi:hypothetical protein
MTKLAFTSLASFALLAVAPTAVDAGSSTTAGFSCASSGGGAPQCIGSMRGARLSAGANNFFSLTYVTAVGLVYSAHFNGTSYTCTVNSVVEPILNAHTLDFNTILSVFVNSSGSCGAISIKNTSTEQANAKP